MPVTTPDTIDTALATLEQETVEIFAERLETVAATTDISEAVVADVYNAFKDSFPAYVNELRGLTQAVDTALEDYLFQLTEEDGHGTHTATTLTADAMDDLATAFKHVTEAAPNTALKRALDEVFLAAKAGRKPGISPEQREELLADAFETYAEAVVATGHRGIDQFVDTAAQHSDRAETVAAAADDAKDAVEDMVARLQRLREDGRYMLFVLGGLASMYSLTQWMEIIPWAQLPPAGVVAVATAVLTAFTASAGVCAFPFLDPVD